MKFTMRIPFTVVPGPRCDGMYTATVEDQHGRIVDGISGDSAAHSAISQNDANEAAVRKARTWAQRVREHAGV